MILYDKLYIGESLQFKKDKIIRKMKKGKVVLRLFCVTLPLGSNGILEIYPYTELLQPWLKDESPIVIGIAGSRIEAFTLIEKLVHCMYQQTGEFSISNYLGLE